MSSQDNYLCLNKDLQKKRKDFLELESVQAVLSKQTVIQEKNPGENQLSLNDLESKYKLKVELGNDRKVKIEEKFILHMNKRIYESLSRFGFKMWKIQNMSDTQLSKI